jgi:hypothetical protein
MYKHHTQERIAFPTRGQGFLHRALCSRQSSGRFYEIQLKPVKRVPPVPSIAEEQEGKQTEQRQQDKP